MIKHIWPDFDYQESDTKIRFETYVPVFDHLRDEEYLSLVIQTGDKASLDDTRFRHAMMQSFIKLAFKTAKYGMMDPTLASRLGSPSVYKVSKKYFEV